LSGRAAMSARLLWSASQANAFEVTQFERLG
jgi:hypothetical protein